MARVIDITKACTIVFMKVRNSLVVQCRERERKKTEDSENVCFKALANRFWLIWKSYSWFNKVVPHQTSIKWIP